MKVLFVSDIGIPWGGSEELWSQTAKELKSRGHHVAVSLNHFQTIHPRVQDLIDQGIDVNFRKSYFYKIKEKISVHFGKKFEPLNEIQKHIKEIRPSIVVFSQATCFGRYLDMLFCLNNKIDYISISQLNLEFNWPNDSNYTQISEAFQNAKKTLFVSMGNLNLFQEQIAEKLGNTEIIYNPFHPSAKPDKIKWPIEGKFNFAFLGRLVFNHKGLDLLLKVFAEDVWKRRDFNLNIYGDGDISLAKKLAVFLKTVNVRFLGHTNNITDVWERNHILVMPSRYEGMPLAILEAMYCKRPVITTDVAGHSEFVNDKNGYLAEAATFRHFNNAVELAWSDKERWQEKGEQAFETVKSKLLSNTPVERLISIILQ